MGKQTKNQTSFSLGEVDDSFFRKTDVEEYWKALKEATNIIITPFGTAQKRPGFIQDIVVESEDPNPPPSALNLRNVQTTYLQDLDGGLQPIQYLTLSTLLYIRTISSPVFQIIDLSVKGYTEDDMAAIDFVPVTSNLILLNKNISPVRVTFTSGFFGIDDFVIDRAPCFDFGEVNYFDFKVELSLNPDKDTVVKIIGITFPGVDISSKWLGGTIRGPGVSDTSDLGFGIIKKVDTTGGNTEFTLKTTNAFDTANDIQLYGFGLLIQRLFFNSDDGWPSKGLYFQDRLWLTGHPKLLLGVFGSKVGVVSNFDIGIALATDAILEVLNTKTGAILYIILGKHIELFTELAQYSTPGSDDGLTPSNSSFKKQTDYSVSALCKPEAFQNYTFFAGADGRSIYSFIENQGIQSSYSTDLVSQYASHLINNPIKLAVFSASSQTLILLAVLNQDNTLVIFQFNEANNIHAWSTFVLDSKLKVLDICSIGHILYALVEQDNGIFIIEKLDTSKIQYCDSAVPVTINSSNIIQSIPVENLNGYQVHVANNTTDLGIFTVTDGAIDILYDFPDTAFVGAIGLFYAPKLVTLALTDAPGLTYNKKSVLTCYVDYTKSLGIIINTENVPFQTFDYIQSGQELVPVSGTYQYDAGEGWQSFPNITITQDYAVDWHITSLGYRIVDSSK